jgi:hypothetical protein
LGRRKSIQRVVLLLHKCYISLHIETMHREIPIQVELQHYLFSEFKDSVVFWQSYHLFLSIETHIDIYVAWSSHIGLWKFTLDHLEENRCCFQTYFWVSFKFLDQLKQTNFPGHYFYLNLALLLRPQEYIYSFLNYSFDMLRSPHLCYKLEVKERTFHIRSQVS